MRIVESSFGRTQLPIRTVLNQQIEDATETVFACSQADEPRLRCLGTIQGGVTVVLYEAANMGLSDKPLLIDIDQQAAGLVDSRVIPEGVALETEYNA